MSQFEEHSRAVSLPRQRDWHPLKRSNAISKLLLRKDLGHLAILSVVEAVGSLAEASLIEKLLGLQPEELARGLSEDVALALLTDKR